MLYSELPQAGMLSERIFDTRATELSTPDTIIYFRRINTESMPLIFLSYRRADSLDIVGRIFDRLRLAFGADALAMDIDTIPAGIDFRKYLADTVVQCKVLLAVIGNNWLKDSISGKAPLHDPTDWVRIEIEIALDRRILTIPVLVAGASMPTAADLPPTISNFSYLNAFQVDSGRDFHTHMDRLIQRLIGFLYGSEILVNLFALGTQLVQFHDIVRHLKPTDPQVVTSKNEIDTLILHCNLKNVGDWSHGFESSTIWHIGKAVSSLGKKPEAAFNLGINHRSFLNLLVGNPSMEDDEKNKLVSKTLSLIKSHLMTLDLVIYTAQYENMVQQMNNPRGLAGLESNWRQQTNKLFVELRAIAKEALDQ